MSAGLNLAWLCIWREVHVLLTGRTSPIVRWLRGLADAEKGDHPGVGVIGMCFSGGFAIATATTESVVAAIASQPALPWPVLRGAGKDLGLAPDDMSCVRQRYRDGAFGVFATRYSDDKKSSKDRIERYKREFGDEVVYEPIGTAHSVLARAANPTCTDEAAVPALTKTIELLKRRLQPTTA